MPTAIAAPNRLLLYSNEVPQPQQLPAPNADRQALPHSLYDLQRPICIELRNRRSTVHPDTTHSRAGFQAGRGRSGNRGQSVDRSYSTERCRASASTPFGGARGNRSGPTRSARIRSRSRCWLSLTDR